MIHIPFGSRAANILTEIRNAGMETLNSVVWYETNERVRVGFYEMSSIVCQIHSSCGDRPTYPLTSILSGLCFGSS